jgi:molybdopterin molybdotransferase
MTSTVRPGLAEYLTGLLAGVRPLRPLELALLDAHGGVLVEGVTAPRALPQFDVAAIDGYAVRAEDLVGATPQNPVRLPVVGDLRAGSWQPTHALPGACFAVAAGAPLPAGADAVTPAAWTDHGLAHLEISRSLGREAYVRRAGSEVAEGALIAAAGTRVTAGLVGLLAAAGVAKVKVRPKPRVAVVSTGDELTEPGRRSTAGRVLDANSYALTAAARDAGAQAIRAGIAGDEPEPLRELLEDHASRSDLVVVTGGTGDGPGDTVRRLLGHDGSVEFVELPVYPAGVLGYGTIGADETPIVCLPGAPAAALIGFEVLARPVLQRLSGAEPVYRPAVKANLVEAVASPEGMREFRPALISERRGGGHAVRPLPGGAHVLGGLAEANGLIVLGEKITSAPAGTTVDVLLLDRRR